jgi:hypothetical protein
MTTIQSKFGAEWEVTQRDDDWFLFDPKNFPQACAFLPRAEVLDSLGAVDKGEVVSELREARAERDEAADTIERVKALRDEALRTAARPGFGYISQVAEWFRKLDAVLTPTKPLPTEPGSVIYIDADVTQERDGILAACQRDGRFRALDGSSGGWDRDTITAWRPAKVVEADA